MKARLVYRVSFRTARDTQRNPVSKNQKRERQRERKKKKRKRRRRRRSSSSSAFRSGSRSCSKES